MKISTLLHAMILAVSMPLAINASAAQIDPAFEFDAPSFSYNDGVDWNLGITFSANQNLDVDALAYYDDAPSYSPHNVALFKMDGTKLAETTVRPDDILLGNFRYSSIASVRLNAGEMYRIIGNSTGDNFTWGVNNFIVNPLLSYLGYSYSEANGLSAQFDALAASGRDLESAVWGPSLSVRAASVEVPEPASYLLMLAGVAVLVMSTQRKQR